jgi:membrane protease YdiL (CAAX protease family)
VEPTFALSNTYTLRHFLPAILFGLWNLAPASIHEVPYPGSPYSFVLYALVLGLSYGYYVFQTGSIRWCTVSHVIHDSLGMAGFTVIVPVELLQ